MSDHSSVQVPNEDEVDLLHGQSIVIAAHTDYIADVVERRTRGERQVMLRRHVPILKQGGVSVVCEHLGGDTPYFAGFPFRNMIPQDPLAYALQSIDFMNSEIDESEGELVLATTIEDIQNAKAADKIAVVYCFEGGMPLRHDLSFLRTFYRLGVRCIGLTWSLRNQLADGVEEQAQGGLTTFGVEVVKEMNRLGVVIDVSHLAERGVREVIEESQYPVIASHSNAAALCGHARNLKDDLICAIARKGGVIGLHGLSCFIKSEGRGGIDDLINHVAHITAIAGVDHVAIGPDILENWPADFLGQVWAGTTVANLNFVYPDEFDSLAKFPNLTRRLLARGFHRSQVVQVLGGNLLRVFGQVWQREDRAPASTGQR